MKITIEREPFSALFQLAAMVAPQRSPKPILQNVKLEVEGGAVVMTATDMELGIRLISGTVEIQQPGTLVVPVGRFGAMLKEMADTKIELEVVGDAAIVTGASSRFEMPLRDPDEFPQVGNFEEESYLELPSRVLKEMIKRTAFAADTESTRYALSGILLEVQEDQSVTAVATDGRRLAKMDGTGRVVGQDTGRGVMTIVPTRTMHLIERMLPDDESAIQMKANNNELKLKTGHGVIHSQLVEGRFPKWREVIPKQRESLKLGILVGTLFAALRQAAVVMDEESRGVNISFEQGTMVLNSQAAEVGQARIEVPIAYEGPKIEVALDLKYLMEMLRVLPADQQLNLDIEGPDSAAYCWTEDHFGYVIMPLSRNKK